MFYRKFMTFTLIHMFLLMWCDKSKCQNDFFLVTKYQNENVWCVTNSSFALSWIMEDINEILNYNSTFIPNKPTNNFDYDINDDYTTRTNFLKPPWHIINSTDGRIKNEVILDYRWEGMKVYRTEPVGGRDALNYETVISTLHDNFNIPLSIRIEKEAHIFLCDGNSPPSSNCYWLMLQAWKGNETTIRKCLANSIPSDNNVYPKPPCSDRLINRTHPNDIPHYLSNKKWAHFRVIKQDKRLTFTEAGRHENQQILELNDEEPIHVTHMIVYSKDVSGLWKIHNLYFIHTNSESTDIKLGPSINATKNYVCVSMFVLMCESCQLKLKLVQDSRTLGEETYTSKNSKWAEIKLVTNNSLFQNRELRLLVSTIGSTENRFWAIDKVRLCQKQEFRMIGLSEKQRCQLIAHEDQIISIKSSTNISDSTCPEETIGGFCVPCDWFYTDCKQVKVCSRDKKCVCSAGYSGDYCYYECSGNVYGHGCKKQCGKCKYNSCNQINGNCTDGCSDNRFSGARCDIRPSIIFVEPPKIIEVTYNTVTVNVTNFQVENGKIPEEPVHYYIQYKKARSQYEEWTFSGLRHNIFSSQPIKIDKLEPDTEYCVRAVITSNTGQTYTDSYVSYSNFTTKCEDISANNIQVQTSNTSAIISIKNRIACKLSKYKVFITDGNTRKPKEKSVYCSNDSVVCFENLNPFSNYNVNFESNTNPYKQQIQTKEGVPEPVQDLMILMQSSSQLHITWSRPASINGILKYYVVQYQHLSYIACNTQSTSPSTKNRLKVTDHFITIKNLIPFSKYSFSVSAVNTEFEGRSQTRYNNTLASNVIGPEEIPKITQIIPGIYGAHIKLSTIACDKMRGPLEVIVTSTCTSEWCINQKTKTETLSTNLPKMMLEISALSPFSNYNLELEFCRNHIQMCNEQLVKQHFQTKPRAPNAVTELLVYTKNETSVSMRWRKPYPPNGILTQYKIEYFNNWNTKINEMIISKMTSCKLWPHLHCAIISNLQNDKVYKFQISARNEDVMEFGGTQPITAKTKIESSEPPYDLIITWNNQNDLKLEWKHPNITNGDIRYFIIKLTDKTSQESKIENKLTIQDDTYNLTYYFRVDAHELMPSMEYLIEVSAYNGLNGKSIKEKSTSPPDIPTFKSEPSVDITENDIITLTVSPKQLTGKTDNCSLILLISDKQSNLGTYLELKQLNLENFSIVSQCDFSKLPEIFNITIGGELQQQSYCKNNENVYLEADTSYNITILLINSLNDTTRYKIYSFIYHRKEQNLLGFLALLLLIPIAAILYVKRHAIKAVCNRTLSHASTDVELMETHSNAKETNTNSQKAKTKMVQCNDVKEDAIYENFSQPVEVKKFQNYVKTSVRNEEIHREHEIILHSIGNTTYETLQNTLHFEFIDINYSSGHHVEKVYLVTSIPKKNKIDDFWKIIWDENIHDIILIDNAYCNQTVYENYWPDKHTNSQYANISVQLISCEEFVNYDCRKFTLHYRNKERQVNQLHLSSRSNTDMRFSPLNYVEFFQKTSLIPLNSKSPILVHSSSGMRGSGFALLCDICLRTAKKDDVVDIMGNLYKLTRYIPDMMIDPDHYVLAHLIVMEVLLHLDTSISCNSFSKSNLFSIEEIRRQINYINENMWINHTKKPEDRESNMYYRSVSPLYEGEVLLAPYPKNNDSLLLQEHLNVITVDNLRSSRQFLVTQQPTFQTSSDFWTLIAERNISVIISPNELFLWPNKDNSQVNPKSGITIQYKHTKNFKFYEWTTLQFENQKSIRDVEIFAMKNWPAKTVCPSDVSSFLNFALETNEMLKKSDSVVVMCHNGITASGLYIAMSHNIQKIKMEGICDICTCVRTIRYICQQFVNDEEQYIFLVKAVESYMKEFNLYETR